METLYFPTQKARLAYVKEKLATDSVWAIRALEIIHAGQTNDEQTRQITVELNGKGFTAFDAEILTSFAKQVLAWKANPKYQSPLSPRQMTLLHKRIQKYATQVIDRSKLATALIVSKEKVGAA